MRMPKNVPDALGILDCVLKGNRSSQAMLIESDQAVLKVFPAGTTQTAGTVETVLHVLKAEASPALKVRGSLSGYAALSHILTKRSPSGLSALIRVHLR